MEAYKDYDLLILQEPYIDTYGNTKATQDWRAAYPTSFLSQSHPICSVMLIQSTLDTNYWMQLSIPGTGNIVAIQISTGISKVTFFGLYIDCLHSATLNLLNSSLATHRVTIGDGPLAHTIWCGDFNCHHPLWDEERNKHLFTAAALRDAEHLLGLVADHGMTMALPKDLPTL